METEKNEHAVIFKMKRLENQNGWIYGILMNNNQIICDTLEIECFDNLECGFYRIMTELDLNHKKMNILIFNKEGADITKFTFLNSIRYKHFSIRLDNNFITVGTREREPLLLNSEVIFKDLLNWIREHENNNIRMYLEVIDQYKK